jgi:regulatory protein
MSLKNKTDYRNMIGRYCAYQERCTSEAETRLKAWGAPPAEIPAMIKSLVKEGFIDDARYARSFARGKFNHNHWGNIRIRHELHARGIRESFIAGALEEIDAADYRAMAKSLLLKKLSEIKDEKNLNIKAKLYNFVTGKGFESDLVFNILNELKF